MAKRNIKFDLDFEQKDILSKFSIKQFDNALINISTYSEGKELNPAGNTCKLYVSVGNEVFLQNNGIRVLENTIEIDLDKNIVSSHGKALGELELTDSNGVFTSTTFIFDIDSKVGEGSTLPNGVEGFIAKHERLIREFKNEINPKVEKLQSDINKSNNEINVINSELKQIERKNIEQDTRLKDVEYKNKVQDVYVKGLFNENNDKRLTIEGEGNSLKLEGSKTGLVEVNKVVGDTMVNLLEKEASKRPTSERFLIGKPTTVTIIRSETVKTLWLAIYKKSDNTWINNISLPLNNLYTHTCSSDSYIGSVAAVVDFVNVDDTKFNSYEDYSNYPLTVLEGDYTNKPIPSEYFEGMQSTFEECKVTQEMVDSGEELEKNLGKYKCVAKVRGKNLFNNNLINSNASYEVVNDRRVYPLKVKANTNYVLKGKQLTDTNIAPSCFLWLSSTKDLQPNSFLRLYPGTNTVDSKLVTSNSEGYLYIVITGYSSIMSNVIPLIQNTIQIEEGTQATTYEPYYERTQTVYLNSPLLKGDEIVCKEDGLYHYHKMGKVVFDASEDEGWELVIGSDKPNDPYYRYYTPLTDALPSSVCLNNRFKYLTGSSVEEEKCYITTNSNFTITKKDVSTLQEFKVWLQSNPVTVVYELAEPYHEKISDDKLLLEIPNSATLSVESVIPCTSISATYTGNVPSVYGLEETGITNTNDIAVTQTAVDFLLMSSMGEVMMMSFKNNTKGGNNMGAYFASRIMKKALKYEDVIRKYPEFKEDIDFILRSEGYGDLIVEL